MSNRTFDPSKKYQWQPNDKIVFTGSEFDVINRALSQFIMGNITNTTVIMKLAEAFSVMQTKLSEYVENGIFTEYIEEPVSPLT